MNACLRAVVRRALSFPDIEVYAIRSGFEGIFKNDFVEFTRRDVSNIIQSGGTIIRTARSKRFYEEENRKLAAEILRDNYFDGLVGIGGNGTMTGLHALSQHWDGQLIGVPGTIDNDVYGSDQTIGFDTSVHTALDAIDKIRDTAGAHQRNFVIEVMGRKAGFIALEVAIAGGCEEVLLPEKEPVDWEGLGNRLVINLKKGKRTNMVVLAEGAAEGKGAMHVIHKLEELTKEKWRTVVLGYIQRGGSPTAKDRVLATTLGAYAVDSFVSGKSSVMVGSVGGNLIHTPLEEVFSKKKALNPYWVELIQVMT